MQQPVWIADPLTFLIGSIPHDEFFAKYHEQKSLLCQHEDSHRFETLLSVARIDDLIANSELPPAALDMARKEPPITRSYFTFKSGGIDRGAVVRHYQQGATIILNQLHLADPTLADFCRALENVLSTHVQTNVYLTPPNSQGFNTHFDDHDVFIIQVSGEKKWRLYQKPVDNPYRGESFKSGSHEPGSLEKEFLLGAGDCIYIPRGLMHDAESHGTEPSLHITVGLLVKKWADLMLEAMSEVALRNPKFRRALPAGFARSDFDRQSAEQTFNELATEFKQEANFEEIFEFFKESFIRLRGPNYNGGLVDATIPVTTADKFVRRVNTQALLRRDDKEAVVVCGGGNLHFEKNAFSGLQSALSGAPFSITDFTDLDASKAEDAIRKLSAFGVVRRINEED